MFVFKDCVKATNSIPLINWEPIRVVKTIKELNLAKTNSDETKMITKALDIIKKI